MWIKVLIGPLAMMSVLLPAAYAADDADAIVGQWVTSKGEARFEISKSKGKYNGKIVWLKEPTYPLGDKEAGKPVRDRKNPDKSKRDRPIIGLELLKGLTYAGRRTWKNGTIYNAEDGKTYKCKVTLRTPDKLHLRGYIGISLVGGTTVWTRYKKPKPSAKELPKETDR
jgi:uncharacterized protein (DUF2147 family)